MKRSLFYATALGGNLILFIALLFGAGASCGGTEEETPAETPPPTTAPVEPTTPTTPEVKAFYNWRSNPADGRFYCYQLDPQTMQPTGQPQEAELCRAVVRTTYAWTTIADRKECYETTLTGELIGAAPVAAELCPQEEPAPVPTEPTEPTEPAEEPTEEPLLDENGYQYYLDENGNYYYLSEEGYAFWYDDQGNYYYYDEEGRPFYYDEDDRRYWYDAEGNPFYY